MWSMAAINFNLRSYVDEQYGHSLNNVSASLDVNHTAQFEQTTRYLSNDKNDRPRQSHNNMFIILTFFCLFLKVE